MSSRKFSDQKHINDALAFLREARAGDLNRRDLLKMGLLSGAGAMVGLAVPRLRSQVAAASMPQSPPTRPFIAPLQLPEPLRPVSQASLSTARFGGRAPNPSAHQFYQRYLAQKFYYMEVVQGLHSFHPDLPPFPVWGYTQPGQPVDVPNPLIQARYGEPVLIRIANRLPPVTTGFGINQMITHLHNFHSATESDGGPWDYYGPGQFKDHHYTMAPPGFTVPDTIPAQFRLPYGGDRRELQNSLFYHDHRPDFTAPNVYRGRVGSFFAFDDEDTGDETRGFRLPSGLFDIPLLLSDKRFDPRTGDLVFDQFDFDGFLGDKYVVNGTVQPFFNVARRKYRFRIVDPGVARFYHLVLYANGALRPFTQIMESGNFLERPRRNITRIEYQPGGRTDIVVDFTQFAPGTEVFLANVLPHDNGRRPERDERLDPANVNNQLMKFIVGAAVPDASLIPNFFRPFPPINLAEVVAKKHWEFERTNGQWAINGQLFDPEADHLPQRLAKPINPIRRNTAEIWTLEGHSGGWEHPVHIHFEEGQVISVDGSSFIRPELQGRRDVYNVGGKFASEVEVFMRFRDFPDPDFRPTAPPGLRGRYVIHCHNSTHEDHAMMQTWNIVDPNVP